MTTLKRSRWSVAVVGLLLCVLIGLLLVVGPQKPRMQVDLSGYDVIEQGMTESEVDGRLRAPAGDYRTGSDLSPFVNPRDRVVDGEGQATVRFNTWITDHGIITVGFDADTGKVVEKEFKPLPRP